MVEFIIVMFVVLIAPRWMILHYSSKKHASQRLTPDDERMLEDLWRSAKAMERRLADLESIVEPDAPGMRAERPQASDRMM